MTIKISVSIKYKDIYKDKCLSLSETARLVLNSSTSSGKLSWSCHGNRIQGWWCNSVTDGRGGCYLATTKNWSIWWSLSWLLGSHTLVSSFSWTRVSGSPEGKNKNTLLHLFTCLLVRTGTGGTTHSLLTCQGSLPDTWSPPGSLPDLPAGSSGLGQRPASRRNSPAQIREITGITHGSGCVSDAHRWTGVCGTSLSRYPANTSVSLRRVTLHFPLRRQTERVRERGELSEKHLLKHLKEFKLKTTEQLQTEQTTLTLENEQ